MMLRLITFSTMISVGGLGYIKYLQYSSTNEQLEMLLREGKLQKHLFDMHEASSYAIDFSMDCYESRYNRSHINNYRKALISHAQGKVLEACAGSNRNLFFYLPGVQLTLIDQSPSMQNVGLTKISPLLNYNYVVDDVTKLNFKDNTFDTVVNTFGLEYLVDPKKALTEMRRVCKKDGKILLLSEGISSFLESHFYQNMTWGMTLMKFGYFSNRDWDKIIREFDFKIQHCERKKNGKIYVYVLKNVKDDDVGKNYINKQISIYAWFDKKIEALKNW